MKILMFGWEFPPYASGGLGTACKGLVKGLANKGHDIIFVAPRAPKSRRQNVKLISAMDRVTFKEIPGLITPYMTEEEYREELAATRDSPRIYGKNLFHEVHLFSERAKRIAMKEDFDVIHVHATEFDRTGGNGVNEYVYQLEKEGLSKADRIITVSNYTKNMVVNNYGIDPAKIDVVHNAVEFPGTAFKAHSCSKEKTVLFLGRITLQKGPDYFIYTARRVLDVYPDARFIVVGSGDMESFIINKAAELGIADKVSFAGFLQGADVDRAYQIADLYVMPSVSEPFGITPLEALRNNVPVIISKQSGVSEVLENALKVDFWDIDEMANKMINVLKYGELREELSERGSSEVKKFNWDEPAGKCVDVYKKILGGI